MLGGSIRSKTTTSLMTTASYSKWQMAFVAVVVFCAFMLRLYQIGDIPKGALIDEAHFGYLAYSLLETGADEHGQPYPIIFKGFGDNKLPAGAYILMPVVKAFGLSNETIRYPSVIAGSLLVIAMYVALRELAFSHRLSSLGAILVAISPWPFFLSRFGFESNLGLAFFTLGLAAFLRGFNTTKAAWFISSAVLFALTWYSYISYRPVVVAFVVCMTASVWMMWPKVRQKVRAPLLWFAVAFCVVVSPLLLPSVIGANSTRLEQVGIFTDSQTELIINENRTFCSWRIPRPLCDVVWNKPVYLVSTVAMRYFHVFSPQYLATVGEGESVFLTIEGHGQFASALYPFLLLGLFGLVLSGESSRFSPLLKIVLPLGLLFAPIPTVLVGGPQQVRLSPLLPFLIIAIVFGIHIAIEKIRVKKLSLVFLGGLFTVVAFQTTSFYVDFFSIHTVKNEQHYQSYLPELFSFLQTVESDKNIAIKPYFSDPIMFYAYYTHYDPSVYQAKAVLGELESSGFQHAIALDNIYVTSDSISHEACAALAEGSQLVFVTNEELDAAILHEVRSAADVHTFAYVYDATKNLELADCDS